MFDLYSKRAKRVIFLARLEAGTRGAQAIELDDLLLALIGEDQNKIPDALEPLGRTGPVVGWDPHEPFLSSDAATSLLETTRQALPRSKPVVNSMEMSVPRHLGKLLWRRIT